MALVLCLYLADSNELPDSVASTSTAPEPHDKLPVICSSHRPAESSSVVTDSVSASTASSTFNPPLLSSEPNQPRSLPFPTVMISGKNVVSKPNGSTSGHGSTGITMSVTLDATHAVQQ